MNNTQKRALSVAVIVAVLFGFYFLKGYFSLVIFAAILAFIYNPTYKWFLRKTNNKQGLSVSLTLLFAFFTIIIPLSLVLALTINQAVQFVDAVKAASIDSDSVRQTINNLIDAANQTIHKIPGQDSFNLSLDNIFSWLKDNISVLTKALAKYLGGFLGGFSDFFTKSIIFIFVFISILKNQKKIIEVATGLNPIGKKASDIYINKISSMTKAMVKGQFIIALAQGIVDASLLWVVGIDYFFFWLVLLTFLSIIPLGGGIIVIPIGIILILTGNIWQGLVLILGHILIVTNIDNILRPKLVPKDAKLDSALLILSVFAGIAMFGFLGIVIGPVIMILIVTTIEAYIKVNKNRDLENTTQISK